MCGLENTSRANRYFIIFLLAKCTKYLLVVTYNLCTVFMKSLTMFSGA